MTVTVQRIVDLTERYGTSGAFIARLCGKSRSLIAGWKDGKAAPTDSDLAAIADLYGVSVAYLRGEVDVPESSVKNALQQQLLDSVQRLADDEMLKVIEYVRFLKFLDAEQKADPQYGSLPMLKDALLLLQLPDVLNHLPDLFRG